MAVNATQQQRAEALLYWINTFPLDSPVESLGQLNDGHALAKVLADIDPSFQISELRNTSNPTNWVPRWENLKLINKALSRYTREECYEAEGLNLCQNLKRIAEDADVEELIELISVLLLASVSGPKAATYVPKISNSEHAPTFASIIQDKQDEDAGRVLPAERDVPAHPNSQAIDIDLALEEKYGDLMKSKLALEQENRRIKGQNENLLTKLDRLEESNQTLEVRCLAAEDKSTELSNRLDISSPEVIKHLEEKIREQDILIGTQEKQIEDDGNKNSSLQRELNGLRNAAEDNKELRIQVEEQKHEIEELSKKANAMERYKQKLELQKHLEPENSRLKQEVSDLYQESARLQKRVEQFEGTHTKYQTTIQNSELELFELRNQKKTIEFENRRLQQEILVLREREEHDSAMISELQEKVAAPGSPDSPKAGMNLQAEIEEAEPPRQSLELEVSRLRHANELLRGGVNGTQEKFDLEVSLSETNRIRETLEKKYHVLYEEHVLLQKQLSEIIEGRAKEGSELDKSYKDLSTRLAAEVQGAKRKIEKLEVELGDKNRELLTAQTELSMVDHNELEKIDMIRTTNSSMVEILQNDYKSLHARYEALQDESTIQKSQLTEALLSKDKIRNERDDLSTLVKSLQDAAVPAVVKEKEEHIKTQTAKIKELQDRLKNYVEGGNGSEIKTEKDETIMNLRRENTLMATAWYDLSTRLQSNNVILQRRSDAPKSWINKNRQAVLGTVPRR